MLERVRENCGQMPAVFTADNGYLSEANVAYCEQSGIDAYIALRKKDAKSTDVPKVLTEPVFGQIKGAMGFRRFSLRGLFKVPSEWGIVATCHNLLKLFRREPLLARGYLDVTGDARRELQQLVLVERLLHTLVQRALLLADVRLEQSAQPIEPLVDLGGRQLRPA